MSDELIEQRHNRVIVLELNRPQHRNALTVSLLGTLQSRVHAALSDPDIGAIVITAAPPVFSSGMDLRVVAEAKENPEPLRELLTALLGAFRTIAEADKPIVAAVNGAAVAGGAGLVTVCDFVVAAESAKIGYPEVKHGLVASIIMPPLVHCVGPRWAQYLLLTGELISAQEAVTIGMAHACTDDADCLPRAIELAERIAGHPAGAYAETKRQLRAYYPTDVIGSLAGSPDEHTHLHICEETGPVIQKFRRG